MIGQISLGPEHNYGHGGARRPCYVLQYNVPAMLLTPEEQDEWEEALEAKLYEGTSEDLDLTDWFWDHADAAWYANDDEGEKTEDY